MGSVSDNPVVELNIVETPPPKTHNETPTVNNVHAIAAKQPIASLKRMWSDYFRPKVLGKEAVMMSGSVLANPVIVLNMGDHELPAEANNQTSSITSVYLSMVLAAKRLTRSLGRMWTPRGTSGEEGVMKPRSAYKLVIFGLLSFAAIKSQGGTTFHPQISLVFITSLLVFGFASYVISTAPPVCAVIAQLVGKLCLFILGGFFGILVLFLIFNLVLLNFIRA